MEASLESITSEALLLPKGQRLTLAYRILASVELPPDSGAAEAWDKEIRERINRYDAGLPISIPATEVFSELDERSKR